MAIPFERTLAKESLNPWVAVSRVLNPVAHMGSNMNQHPAVSRVGSSNVLGDVVSPVALAMMIVEAVGTMSVVPVRISAREVAPK